MPRDSSRHPPHLPPQRAGSPRYRPPATTRTGFSRRAAWVATGLDVRAVGLVPTLAARMGPTLKGDAMDPEPRAERPLVLLAEDEAIIAIDLEDSLRAAGFAVAGPFATNAQAEAWLETGQPDVACLDHELGDGPCDELVRTLARRGVPAIIFTGHDARRESLSELSTATWVMKPVAFSTLLGKLRRVMRRRGEPRRDGLDPGCPQ